MVLTLFVLYSAYKVALVFFWSYYRSSLYHGGVELVEFLFKFFFYTYSLTMNMLVALALLYLFHF
jgi:hypothetical protein